MNDLSPRHDIQSFWRPENSGKISLHLGEFCFPPTERVLNAIAEAGKNANRYPDTNCLALRDRLAAYVGNGVKPENIIAGNGSDELIDLAAVSFSSPESNIATFSPTFFVYGFAAKRHGSSFDSISRADDYSLPSFDSLPDGAVDDRIALTFIANPNNPTGTLTPRERLIEYLNQWPGMIVVDECYFEYSGETIVDLIHKYDNMIVFRSLSKSFGLSGLRIGYAVAARSVIETMERYALTFPVNVCAQAAGIAALEDVEIYRARINELIQRRDTLKQILEEYGLKVPPSSANFLLSLWPESWNEKHPAKMLAERGILVSDQTATMNAGRPALRIAIGTEEENGCLLKVLEEMLT